MPSPAQRAPRTPRIGRSRGRSATNRRLGLGVSAVSTATGSGGGTCRGTAPGWQSPELRSRSRAYSVKWSGMGPFGPMSPKNRVTSLATPVASPFHPGNRRGTERQGRFLGKARNGLVAHVHSLTKPGPVAETRIRAGAAPGSNRTAWAPGSGHRAALHRVRFALSWPATASPSPRCTVRSTVSVNELMETYLAKELIEHRTQQEGSAARKFRIRRR